jgi:hypothetical protein
MHLLQVLRDTCRLDDALEAERMGIDRNMNKRQQKIEAAKVRRLLARSEQVCTSAQSVLQMVVAACMSKA